MKHIILQPKSHVTALTSFSFMISKLKKNPLYKALPAKRAVLLRRKSQTKTALTEYSSSFARAMRVNLPKMIDQVDLKKIKTLYDSGQVAEAGAIELDLGFLVTDSQNTMFEAVARGAGIETEAALNLGSLARVASREAAERFMFDPLHEPVVQWIRKRSVKLVDDISRDQRLAIREAIASHFNNGLSSSEMTASIQRNIGLTARQTTANNNYYRRMLEQGVKRDERDRRAVRYANRQLQRRAEQIAGDEMHVALNVGRQQMWEQFAEENDVSEIKIVRTWITADDEDVCEICTDMMGVTVPLGEPYTLPDGEQTMEPYAHSNCRCDELIEPEL